MLDKIVSFFKKNPHLNIILNSGIMFPNDWKTGIIVPLYKSRNFNSVENYRQITQLSVTGKLFTSIVNTRRTSWTEMYIVYNETQAGFRPGFFCG